MDEFIQKIAKMCTKSTIFNRITCGICENMMYFCLIFPKICFLVNFKHQHE